MKLEQFGWNPYFDSSFQPHRHSGRTPGRVALAQRGLYVVWTAGGEMECAVSGRLRHNNSDWPAVGDWVVLRNRRQIEAVLPRRTKFSRKQAGVETQEQVLAANIDVLFLVSGLDGDFNLRRLERYLLLAWESGARPVVVLNKGDVCADRAAALALAESVAAGAPVHAVSALEGWGLAALTAHLKPGETAALIGSSGAGKSTIINRVLGLERQRVQPVRVSDSRGRHTTTQRELILLPEGWLLMDLPGLRELQLWAEPENADRAFADITNLARHCRFRDCRHQGEPGCAVAMAGIDAARLENYRKIHRELAYLDRKQDQRAALEEKRRWKRIHRAMRHMSKPGW